MNDDNVTFSISREVLMQNPELIASLYKVCDKQKLLDWLMKRNPEEQQKSPDAINEEFKKVCSDSSDCCNGE